MTTFLTGVVVNGVVMFDSDPHLANGIKVRVAVQDVHLEKPSKRIYRGMFYGPGVTNEADFSEAEALLATN